MVQDRLSLVRQWMVNNGYSALIVPSTDPHMSEYVADRWKVREWLSGFDGSAGTLVVSETEAGLWTDPRYFLQAEKQLEGSCIRLFRSGLPGVPDFTVWLSSVLDKGSRVAADASLFTITGAEMMADILAEAGIDLVLLEDDPFDVIWKDRPGLPANKIMVYPEQYSGMSASEKISLIRQSLMDSGAECLFTSMLDEIAWILNLRGSDIEYNPVFVSYLLVFTDKAILFIENTKLTGEVNSHLRSVGVEVMDYGSIKQAGTMFAGRKVIVDPSKNSALIGKILSVAEVLPLASPVAMMKALRNETEIKGLRNAMLKDGVALVRFAIWLEDAVAKGSETEYTIGLKLRDFRSMQPLFVGESFAPIVGFRENGAIVHYEASEATAAKVSGNGLLLIDSGAQYLDGTTDITRTFAFGNLTDEEKTDYTLVLKGNIQLAMACFPEGTRGTQLDVLARAAMWKAGFNYLHGTGHGVGHFLNVHEGPQAIRMNDVPVALRLGMVTSNEPGIYKSERHGVRLENLMLVRNEGAGEFGQFYSFETVTLFPFDRNAIVADMLTGEELDWLNAYHKKVYEILSPMLSEEERIWLLDKTAKI